MTTIGLEPIIPDIKKIIDVTKLERELKGALDHTANIIRDDFKRTVRTWRTPVSFQKKGPKQTRRGLSSTVSTNNEIYFFVDGGTRAHPIPRTPGFLRFQTGYRAKTRVGVVGSRGGGPRGPFVVARQVMHPGTAARGFAKLIAKRRQKNLVNLTRLAFNRSFRFGGA